MNSRNLTHPRIRMTFYTHERRIYIRIDSSEPAILIALTHGDGIVFCVHRIIKLQCFARERDVLIRYYECVHHDFTSLNTVYVRGLLKTVNEICRLNIFGSSQNYHALGV